MESHHKPARGPPKTEKDDVTLDTDLDRFLEMIGWSPLQSASHGYEKGLHSRFYFGVLPYVGSRGHRTLGDLKGKVEMEGYWPIPGVGPKIIAAFYRELNRYGISAFNARPSYGFDTEDYKRWLRKEKLR